MRWTLNRNPKIEVAQFCVYSCQIDSLRLGIRRFLQGVGQARPSRQRPASTMPRGCLLKQMLALGVSRYHPAPIAAIEEAKRVAR
jgi:hypothetical protein